MFGCVCVSVTPQMEQKKGCRWWNQNFCTETKREKKVFVENEMNSLIIDTKCQLICFLFYGVPKRKIKKWNHFFLLQYYGTFVGTKVLRSKLWILEKGENEREKKLQWKVSLRNRFCIQFLVCQNIRIGWGRFGILILFEIEISLTSISILVQQ